MHSGVIPKEEPYSTTAQFNQVPNKKKLGLSKKIINRVVMQAMEAQGNHKSDCNGGSKIDNIQNAQ